MNNLILTAVKAIKQCGYEPHIEGDEVYFYTPKTEYVFSIELQGHKFWLNRIDMDIVPPFQMYKTVDCTKETITNADISNLVLQIPTRNLSELRDETNFNLNNKSVLLNNQCLLNLCSQLCELGIDNVTTVESQGDESVVFELHNRTFAFSMLDLTVDIFVEFGMYQENGNEIALVPADFFARDEDISKWLFRWLVDYNTAFADYCCFKFCQ